MRGRKSEAPSLGRGGAAGRKVSLTSGPRCMRAFVRRARPKGTTLWRRSLRLHATGGMIRVSAAEPRRSFAATCIRKSDRLRFPE